MFEILDYMHSSTNVSDMNRALKFYQDFLGLKFKSSYEMTPDHPRNKLYANLFGLERCHFKNVKLETSKGKTVELMQWIYPKGRPRPKGLRISDPGYTWVGIPIEDTRGLFARQPHWMYERWVAAPITVVGPGHTVAFVYDPDGNAVELTNNDHVVYMVRDVTRTRAFLAETMAMKVGIDYGASVNDVTDDTAELYEHMFSLPKPKLPGARYYGSQAKEIFRFTWQGTQEMVLLNGGVEVCGWNLEQQDTWYPDRKVWDDGMKWAGVVVKDVRAAYQELSAKGVPFLSSPVESKDPNWRIAVCRDPEGNYLELLEFY